MIICDKNMDELEIIKDGNFDYAIQKAHEIAKNGKKCCIRFLKGDIYVYISANNEQMIYPKWFKPKALTSTERTRKMRELDRNDKNRPFSVTYRATKKEHEMIKVLLKTTRCKT